MMNKIIPHCLQKGDEIRVVAPSTGIKIIGADSRQIAKERFEKLGLKVSFGKNTIDENFDMMGSTDIEKRAQDINEAFGDKNVKAIFTIIGGFNSNQLLPFLDYELIAKNPKILCGFSDITALLNGIYAKTGMVTFMGPHYSSCGMKKGFEYSWEYMQKMLLKGGKVEILPSDEWSDDLWFINQDERQFVANEGWWKLQQGKVAEVEGVLIGGNLGTFNLLAGSEYMPQFETDTVLMIEDCFTSGGDAKAFLRNWQAIAYRADFKNVKAIIIGRFQKASEVSRELLQYMVDNIPQLKGLPIIANLDFGHTTPLLTLPVGGKAKIVVSDEKMKVSVNA